MIAQQDKNGMWVMEVPVNTGKDKALEKFYNQIGYTRSFYTENFIDGKACKNAVVCGFSTNHTLNYKIK